MGRGVVSSPFPFTGRVGVGAAKVPVFKRFKKTLKKSLNLPINSDDKGDLVLV